MSTPDQRIRVAVADDNPEISRTLVELLEPEFCVAAVFFSGTSVLHDIHKVNPDVLVLDIALGDVDGFQVAEQLAKRRSPSRIVFLTVHESTDFVRAAFDLGAWGYVFKSRLSTDLSKAIRCVMQGKHFVPIAGERSLI